MPPYPPPPPAQSGLAGGWGLSSAARLGSVLGTVVLRPRRVIPTTASGPALIPLLSTWTPPSLHLPVLWPLGQEALEASVLPWSLAGLELTGGQRDECELLFAEGPWRGHLPALSTLALCWGVEGALSTAGALWFRVEVLEHVS